MRTEAETLEAMLERLRAEGNTEVRIDTSRHFKPLSPTWFALVGTLGATHGARGDTPLTALQAAEAKAKGDG